MIDSLIELKNFASFKDFNETINFKKVNLFFGYNGSGKTSITRFFKCLSDNKLNQDFQNANFKITLDGDKTKYTERNFPTKYDNKIKIFNIDFINNELKFDESKVNKISAIIGKKNIYLDNRINLLEKLRKNHFDKNKKLKEENIKDEQDKSLNSEYSSYALEIKNDIGGTYNKKNYIDDFFNYSNITISEEEYSAARDLYKSNVKEVIPTDIILKFRNILQFFPKVEIVNIIELLKTPIKRKNIEFNDKELKWLEDGLSLHNKEHKCCQFCSKGISDNEWNLIKERVLSLIKKDTDYEKNEIFLGQNKEKIYNYISEIDNFNVNLVKQSFVNQAFFNEYDNMKNKFDLKLKDLALSLKNLKELIVNKIDNKGDIYSYSKYNYLLECKKDINEIVEKIINIIERNNNTVKELDNEKDKAKKLIINYYISKNYDRLREKTNKISELENNISRKKKKFEYFDVKIKEYREKLVNQKVIIDTINNKLINLLDINLVFEFDQNLDAYILKRRIDRSTIPAKNLSEGEKNFIAFLYFLISLETSSDKDKKMKLLL